MSKAEILVYVEPKRLFLMRHQQVDELESRLAQWDTKATNPNSKSLPNTESLQLEMQQRKTQIPLIVCFKQTKELKLSPLVHIMIHYGMKYA